MFISKQTFLCRMEGLLNAKSSNRPYTRQLWYGINSSIHESTKLEVVGTECDEVGGAEPKVSRVLAF
jgi:hypothetical protein